MGGNFSSFSTFNDVTLSEIAKCPRTKYTIFEDAVNSCFYCDNCKGIVENNGEFTLMKSSQLVKNEGTKVHLKTRYNSDYLFNKINYKLFTNAKCPKIEFDDFESAQKNCLECGNLCEGIRYDKIINKFYLSDGNTKSNDETSESFYKTFDPEKNDEDNLIEEEVKPSDSSTIKIILLLMVFYLLYLFFIKIKSLDNSNTLVV